MQCRVADTTKRIDGVISFDFTKIAASEAGADCLYVSGIKACTEILPSEVTDWQRLKVKVDATIIFKVYGCLILFQKLCSTVRPGLAPVIATFQSSVPVDATCQLEVFLFSQRALIVLGITLITDLSIYENGLIGFARLFSSSLDVTIASSQKIYDEINCT
ncbi:hypothetical protein [Pseudomonas agarici]|nr:hypothetical protein [Pseudomonas agarici]NWB93033.1 hypothetical protein [Pseudomonas agarici]NWC09300.1 hypothetical protein [Pseudomonas agarici]